MATKNLIPRGNGEGGIGIAGTSWGSGVFNTGVFNDSLTVGGSEVALSSELSNYATTADLSNYVSSDDLNECFNYTVGLTGHIIPDTNAAYDLGNAEYKIRHLFLSDNSLHIGGTTISAGDTLGEIQFPSGITVTKDSSFDGSVGIGTTSPDEPLHIESTSDSLVKLVQVLGPSQSDVSHIEFFSKDGVTETLMGRIGIHTDTDLAEDEALYLQAYDSNNVMFRAGGNTRMLITNDGNVGIGATNPSHTLEVRSPSADQTASILIAEGDGDVGGFKLTTNTTSTYRTTLTHDDVGLVFNTSPVRPYCFMDGNIGIGTTTPADKFHIKGDDARMFISSDDFNLVSIGRRASDDLDAGHLALYQNGDKTIQLDTLGDTFFTGGNVGIGTASPSSTLDIHGDLSISGVLVSGDSDGRILFGDEGIMVGSAAVKPDPDNPESIYFQAIPQVKDSEGNAVTVLTADKLGLGTSDVLQSAEQDLQFKLLTDQQRFVVGTTGDYGLESGWYRFNDFKVKGATDIGSHPINPVDTRIYSDESSFILFKTDVAGNRVAHLVGGDESVTPNNAIALGIAVKVDEAEYPEDIEFVHTDGESYSVINGNSDSLGPNGLPIRQGFQAPSIGSHPAPLLIDGGSF